MFDFNTSYKSSIAGRLLISAKVLRLAVCTAAVVALLSSVSVVSAKDSPADGKQSSRTGMAVSVQGKVRGLERAYQRGDGAIVVSGHLNGNGKVVADHVVLEGIVSPGNSPGCIDFTGNVTFNPSATLIMELAGTTPCSEYDQINVANTLTINNSAFELVLINGFVPQFGNSFAVLNWGALSGSGFSSIDTSAAVLPHPLQWDLSQLELTGEVVVGVINIADGDLAPWGNPDGNINAADLMIATQLALEQRVPGALQYAHGDMNNDGVIDIVDLLLIRKIIFP